MTAIDEMTTQEELPSVLIGAGASDLLPVDTQHHHVAAPVADYSATISLIRELSRQRTDIQRAELRLTMQIGAIARRMAGGQASVDTLGEDASDHAPSGSQTTTDTQPAIAPALHTDSNGDLKEYVTHVAVVAGNDEAAAGEDPEMRDALTRSVDASATLASLPLIEARDHLIAARKPIEKRLEKLAKMLPVYPWVAGVRGFGALSLAKIVGEAGDLSNYSNPAKLWKRMGMAVMPDGSRQRKVSGAEALAHGYAPQRRSLMYVIGDGLVKQNQTGAYRTAYDTYKAYQAEINPDMTPMQRHLRAKRYMEKRLLLHLWRAWGLAVRGEAMTEDIVLNEEPIGTWANGVQS